MADSVVSGYLRIWYRSRWLVLGRYLRGYFGLRSSLRVFGRWNLIPVRIFFEVVFDPLVIALATPLAFSAAAQKWFAQHQCRRTRAADFAQASMQTDESCRFFSDINAGRRELQILRMHGGLGDV